MELFVVISCWILYNFKEAESQSPIISPSPTVNVMEGDNMTLTCTYNATQTIIDKQPTLTWNATELVSNIVFFTECNSFSANKHLATCNLSNLNLYTLQLTLNSRLYNHGQTIRCVVQYPGVVTQSETHVFITVPVKNVTFSTNYIIHSIIQHNDKCLTCHSSGSRPRPWIEWFFESETNSTNITAGSNVTYYGNESTTGLEIASTKCFTAYKNLSDISLICTAQNGYLRGVNSSLKLNILHGPQIIKKTFLNKSSIEGNSFKFDCLINPGNPNRTFYNWTRGKDNHKQLSKSLHFYPVKRADSDNYTCSVYNIMKETGSKIEVTRPDSASFFLDVLYPPDKPTFVPDLTTLKGVVRVIESHILNVTCHATGNPPASTFNWNVHKGFTIQRNHVFVQSISQSMAGNCTCIAKNNMSSTEQGIVVGQNASYFTVDVLYKPKLTNLPNISVEEGHSLKVMSIITSGNPNNTQYQWSGSKDILNISAHALEIDNVTRNHSAFYSCQVHNIMKPSFGKEENGIDKKSFYLDVLYKTTIKRFLIKNQEMVNNSIILDENTNFTLECIVDSNPYSTITLEHNGKLLKNQNDTLDTTYIHSSAKCSDSGVYTCIGFNPIGNNETVTVNISVFITCYPRSIGNVIKTIGKAQNDNATFEVHFVAYPEPDVQNYLWQKFSPNGWINLTSSGAVNITTGILQTRLIIRNITRDDYGNYSLWVSNNIAENYYEVFELRPHGPPETPANVIVTVIGKGVTVSWEPAFDGGLNQTFAIQSSTDSQKWDNVTYSQNFNISNGRHYTNIKDFELNVDYYIRIYSYNSQGRSDPSGFVPFKIIPESESDIQIDNETGINYTKIFGYSLLAIVILLVFAAIVYFVKKGRNSNVRKQITSISSWCFCFNDDSATTDQSPMTNKYENVMLDSNNQNEQVVETSLLTEPPTHKDCQSSVVSVSMAVESIPVVGNSNLSKQIAVSNIRTICMAVRKHPDHLAADFRSFKTGKQYDTVAANKPSNKSKNRYREMHPYDKNRVVLPIVGTDQNSDYINASFIDGQCGQKYIASQAALEKTLPDFWRMIWTQNITQIVMLTNCNEDGRLKCFQYWPNEGSKIYGNVVVSLITEDVFSEYTIRTLSCCSDGDKNTRTVTQYHFTAWPDKDVPDTCVSLVQLWKMVKNRNTDSTAPLMVHCSAGVGRTGTFLALDYLHDQGQAEGFVNFHEFVVNLRDQRMTMVQTVDQYSFLHHAVLEALDPIVKVCKTDAFKALRQQLLMPATDSCSNRLDSEYMMLEAESHVEVIPTVGDDNKICAKAPKRDEFGDSKLSQNKDKSRNKDILPSDLYRPVLEMEVPGCGDYINAVVLSTYRFIDRMIITQVPMSNTIIDLLRMVWDFDVSTVVLMDKDIPKNDMYWPTSGKRSFGIFEAEVVNKAVGKCFIKRTVRYTVNGANGKVEQKDVLILQFTVWPEDNLPDPKAMTSLIAELERKHVMTDPNAPFVVQCMDGATKSGLFCVLWSVLERMKFEREVAISETVRFLRTRRKQIIRNFAQYQYCYDLVQQYLDEFEVYNNVV